MGRLSAIALVVLSGCGFISIERNALGAVDDGGVDAGELDAGMPDAGPCNGPLPSDSDGDGLPDYRDPHPTECDLPVFEDVFSPPDSSWSVVSGSLTESARMGWVAEPGQAQVNPSSGVYSMVEMMFEFGADVDPTSWSVHIRLGPSGDNIVCQTILSDAIDRDYPMSGMGTRLRIGADTPTGSWGNFPAYPYDSTLGQAYVLQMRYDGSGVVDCILFNDFQQVFAVMNPADTRFPIPPMTGPITVGTTGRVATLTRVRIYAQP